MTTYIRFSEPAQHDDDLVIKLYHSGDQIRGFIRRALAREGEDAIFPGEEMEPLDAFQVARNHLREGGRILVELSEGVQWNPAWGELQG